jgi:hypothetical protein
VGAVAVDNLHEPQEVSLAVVYNDEHLLQLEAVVKAGHWRGRARAYTVPNDIATFAVALQQFAGWPAPSAEFVAGAYDGFGLIALRFYRFDRAGHIACHVRLASDGVPNEHRPEEVFRLAMEVKAESWAVGRFGKQLAELARMQSGLAVLSVEADTLNDPGLSDDAPLSTFDGI